ncbi:replication protein [human papillomavirus 137]|uniref:Replication protein E1 n=1 Tax=human papillomavirus 137 TaxID=1070410 RepID=I3P6L9_9PAPI|nr:replication protein [human papillomavirus 137]AEM24609.1 replication protein [human papillomavirus 137]
MGETSKGTDYVEKLDESCFIITEAVCENEHDTLEELFDESTDGSNISDLIDDDVDEVDQGISLALYNSQLTEDCEIAISNLKRKYVKSPQQAAIAELSPRLEAIKLTPERKLKRRLLFQDSGIAEDETANSSEQVETIEPSSETNNGASFENGADDACRLLLLSNNRRATMLAKFKDYFQVPYTELTRTFKSNKTCADNWIVVLFAVSEEVLDASKVMLQQHCVFFQLTTFVFTGLYLLQFMHSKNRETIIKLFQSVLNIQDFQILCDPPKIRSVPAALWFYKKSLTNASYMYGSLPDWVTKQTMVNHQSATSADSFDLSQMVQWAYDNGFTEDSEIAYHYACSAEFDNNALAFLNSNNQVKHVRDCSSMVKLYKRQEMKEMTMSDWIFKCCNECNEEEDWKVIIEFLKYQQINVVEFLTALRSLFKQLPKKNCLLIHGKPDTGKSYFCYSLVQFLKGKVVSPMNRASVFWLQPLVDTKIGFIDDVTMACWLFMDTNMRNALDGNVVCIDNKHKAPLQIKLPPLLLTSNIDVKKEPTLFYLHNRLMSFEFPNIMPFTADGKPVYTITHKHWTCFFRKLAKQLDLSTEDNNESNGSEKPFRCTARCSDDSL